MVINPIVGVYIPIIRIPSLKMGWVYPQYSDFWPWFQLATLCQRSSKAIRLIRSKPFGENQPNSPLTVIGAKIPVEGHLQKHFPGQIIATSHDLTPNGGLVREIPLISGKSRLVKYYNLARFPTFSNRSLAYDISCAFQTSPHHRWHFIRGKIHPVVSFSDLGLKFPTLENRHGHDQVKKPQANLKTTKEIKKLLWKFLTLGQFQHIDMLATSLQERRNCCSKRIAKHREYRMTECSTQKSHRPSGWQSVGCGGFSTARQTGQIHDHFEGKRLVRICQPSSQIPDQKYGLNEQQSLSTMFCHFSPEPWGNDFI